MEKKEEKIFRDIVKILEQDVPQEALAEGNPTPEQEAIALIKQELSKAREEGYEKGVGDGMKGKVFSKVEIKEEWREGLDNIDLMLAMLQSIENCTDEEVRNTAKAIREELDKVSQLLSERTFSKEELYRLSIWSGDIGAFGIVSKEDAELINKIYKLLDEENEHIKTHKKFLKLAEKQEEWREIDKDIWYEIGGKRYISINGEEYVRAKDISQLLSERTFTKEELEYLKACIGIVYDKWKINGKETDTFMVEKLWLKISKLLKREEENKQNLRRTV